MLEQLQVGADEKLLIIAPHPDDESIGVGGILQLYAKQCDVICLTDGRQGQGDIRPNKLKEIRAKEFEHVMILLGINSYKMLNIEDGKVPASIKGLCDVDFGNYSKVFVTSDEDGHLDHSMALRATLEAIQKSNAEVECFAYEVHNMINNPTHILDISAVFELKIKTIGKYESQIKNFAYDEYIGLINKIRGMQSGLGYECAEAYKLISKISNVNASHKEKELQKMREFYWIYSRWINAIQNGRQLSEYFRAKNYSRVIIYGYKELGKQLYRELTDCGIDVVAIIDKNKKLSGNDTLNIFELNEFENEKYSDVPVVVTACFYYEEISSELRSVGYKKIFSLKNIIEEMEDGLY